MTFVEILEKYGILLAIGIMFCIFLVIKVVKKRTNRDKLNDDETETGTVKQSSAASGTDPQVIAAITAAVNEYEKSSS
uniref:Uncharacterized protein n=1 Tax=uncultured bacterium contig00051 TaxID=1181535 RepID=A0A806K2C6_9BACT|nr:hypothetical protein [uncultured bacterium contig00051]